MTRSGIDEVDTSSTARLETALRNVRFELVPMRGVGDQIDELPPGATVTVTSSPSQGLDATFELAERLVRRGFDVVPHLAARQVVDRTHLAEVLDRLAELAVRDVFVVAGDAAQPAGAFPGSVDLLRAMSELGHDLEQVGITGYPESHAVIDDATTIRAMFDKAPHATYIVSQICYDPATTAGWIRSVRARGVELPIFVGLPGVVDRVRLLRISLRVGLGDSLRFLSKGSGVASRLLTGYAPDELVDGLATTVADPAARVVGWHFFTFNEVARTVAWWRDVAAAAPPETGAQP